MEFKNKAVFNRISKDFIMSILASVIVTIATTFFVNPILAKRMDSDSYGLLLTLAALVTMLSAVFGNTLSNVRLVQNNKKDLSDNNHTFNYKAIIFISAIIASILTIMFALLYYKVHVTTVLLVGAFAFLATFKNYYIVVFRVKINTVKNFIVALFQGVVYIFAVLLIKNVLIWPLIYILGEIVTLVYIRFKTEIPREKLKTDKNLKPIMKTFTVLMISTFVSQVILYLDRFLIYPILGGEAVTIYTVSTIYSKLLVMVFAPIAFVLLSYYSQPEIKMTRKLYWLINVAVLICSSLFLLTVPIFAPIFTKILYLQYLDLAKPYFFIGAIGLTLSNIVIMANPAVLKFASSKWQLISIAFYGATYLGLGILFLNLYGIMGFYWATIISNLGRVVLLFVIGDIAIIKMNKLKIIEDEEKQVIA